MSHRKKFLEIAISVAFMGIALAVFIEISDLPPGLIDPLGSAPVPRWTATIFFLLSLAMLVRVFLPAKDEAVEDSESPDEGVTERPMAALGVAALTIVYVLALSSRAVGFSVLTATFVFALVILLSDDRRNALWMGLLLAVITGFGCEYLFTQIFVVDLPTWW